MFCHVPIENVITVHDCKSIYHVPILLYNQDILQVVTRKLSLTPLLTKIDPGRSPIYRKWRQLKVCIDYLNDIGGPIVDIALVGKYTTFQDSYISVVKALEHAALSCNRRLNLQWVEASDLENPEDPKYLPAWKNVYTSNGVIIPGGFGERGIEGKIAAAKWAREHNIPFLGICLGMQIAVAEFARNVCNLNGKK